MPRCPLPARIACEGLSDEAHHIFTVLCSFPFFFRFLFPSLPLLHGCLTVSPRQMPTRPAGNWLITAPLFSHSRRSPLRCRHPRGPECDSCRDGGFRTIRPRRNGETVPSPSASSGGLDT